MHRRWVRGCLAGLAALSMTAMALAEAPKTSPRPMPRPMATAVLSDPVQAVLAQATPAPSHLRPKRRPETLVVPLAQVPAVSRPEVVISASAAVLPLPEKKGLFGFLRPSKRPEGLAERKLASAGAIRGGPGTQGVVSKKGSVCGDPAIKGETLAPITSRVNGCGVPKPVKITSVAGVRLSQSATLDCDTAKALKSWVERGVMPAYGKGKVVELQVAGHYVCRTRNHRSGAKLSEHSKGRAIDISGFTLSNGKTVSVARNFDKTMRKAHKAACGIFGTTLGPGSDGMHEDQLHFDTARHRSGAYCR